MTKEEIIYFENKLSTDYYAKLKEVRNEFLKNSEIQVGDFVEVFWESRDFGKESKKLVVSFLGARLNDNRNWMYYFNNVKKDGNESKRSFTLPKYSKIYKIRKLQSLQSNPNRYTK